MKEEANEAALNWKQPKTGDSKSIVVRDGSSVLAGEGFAEGFRGCLRRIPAVRRKAIEVDMAPEKILMQVETNDEH